MKICLNCHTENHDTADKCVHCHMPENFSEPDMPHDALTNRPTVNCRNCGSEEPGHGPKCVHCHFPLPAGAPHSQHHSLSKISVKSNWRTG